MTKDVVIVGGGVVGLCAALYAARDGHRVTVVERDGPERFTTSFGNAGLITPSHVVPLAAPGAVAMGLRWMGDPESPFHVRPRLDRDLARWSWHFARAATPAGVERGAPVLARLNLASRALFVDLAREHDDFGLTLRGCLMVCRTAEALAHEDASAGLARRLGLEPETLDAVGLARLEPGVRFDAAGAVFYPEDAHLDPARFMASLAQRVEDAGGRIRWRTEVTGWRTEPSGRVAAVETSAGAVEADAFVLAGGAWTPGLVRGLGLRLPMQAGKGYHLVLDRPPARPTRPLILVEGRVAVTPMGEAVRFAGTMEIAGLDPAVNPARIRGIVKTVPQYLPDVPAAAFDGVAPWVGHRPLSPDGLPYVGAFARHANLVAATGHAMMGLSLAPVTGRLVADLVAGVPSPFDLAPLSPDRFG